MMPFDNTVKELLHTPPANTLPTAEVQTEFIVIYYNNKRTIISSPEASSLNHLMCLIEDAVKKITIFKRDLVPLLQSGAEGHKTRILTSWICYLWVLFQGTETAQRKTLYLWKVCEHPAPKSPSQEDKIGHGERFGPESSTLKTSIAALFMGFLL